MNASGCVVLRGFADRSEILCCDATIPHARERCAAKQPVRPSRAQRIIKRLGKRGSGIGAKSGRKAAAPRHPTASRRVRRLARRDESDDDRSTVRRGSEEMCLFVQRRPRRRRGGRMKLKRLARLAVAAMVTVCTIGLTADDRPGGQPTTASSGEGGTI